MIDLNWTELLALAVLAVIMFGPEKLPEFARKAARILAYLRQIGNDARGQLRAELGPEFDNISLADLNPKTFVAKHLLSAEDKDDLLAIRDEFQSVGSLASGTVKDARAMTEDLKSGAAEAAEAAGAPTPFDPEAT